MTLSAKQRDAVARDDGNLLVETGPATGKTAMLAARWLHLRALGVDPERVLCLTFSRDGARALRECLASSSDEHAPIPSVLTFSEIGTRGRRLARPGRAMLLAAARASVTPPLPRATEASIEAILRAETTTRAQFARAGGVRLRALTAAAEQVLAFRRDCDLADHDDPLTRETLARYEHLLIDELQAIAARERASLARFVGTIFAVGSAVSERTTQDLRMRRLTPAHLENEPIEIEVHVAHTPFDEAALIAERIAAEIAAGTAPERVAATARAIEPSGTLLRSALERLGVRATLCGERRSAPGTLPRTVLDGLRAIDRPEDPERWHDLLRQPVFGYPPLRLARALLRTPPRSIEDALALLDQIGTQARLPRERIATALREARTQLRRGSVGGAARVLAQGFDLLGFALAHDPDAGHGLGAALDALQQLEDLRAKIGASDQSLASLLADFEEHAAAFDDGDVHDGVRILPVERLAARRFDVVFLLDAADGRFPIEQRRDGFLDDADLALARSLDCPLDVSREEHVARERALWSLVATRARRRLIVTHARVTLDDTPLAPSRFLSLEQRRALAAQPPYRAPLSYDGTERVPPPSPARPVVFPPRIAVTRLDDWLRCERRFFFSAIARLASESAYRATFGTCLHAVLEAFHQEHRSFDGGDAALIARWDDALQAHRHAIWNGARANFASVAERDAAGFAADRLLRSYARSLGEEARHAPFSVDAIERTVSIEMNGLELRGKIDRTDRLTDGSARIVDFKTGRFRQKASKGFEALANALERGTLRTANEPASIASPQLLLYRRAIPDASATALIFLGGDDDGETTIDELALNDHRELIERVDIALAQDFGARAADPPSFFAPTRNARTCGTCNFSDICDASLAAEAEG